MNDLPTPRELRGAAAAARTLAYALGLAGVVAGATVYQQGDVAIAVAVWVLTFAVGAVLMIAGFLLQAATAILARITAIESSLQALAGRGPIPGEEPQARL